MCGVRLTVRLGDRPVLLAKVLQPRDGEKGDSYAIWVLFYLLSGTEAAGRQEKMFASWGLKWLEESLLKYTTMSSFQEPLAERARAKSNS